MPSDLKLAIWDIDGTIVDSRQVIQRAMARAFERAGLPPIEYDRTRTLYEGARETIERLAGEGWLLGVATGKARRGLDIVFGHHDLHRYFDTFQTVDGGAGKPHPRMVLDAMKETGTDPHQAVMIGDTSFDMEMGRNAGVHTLGVSWGFHTEDEIRGGGAHDVHHDFDALNRALDLFGRGVEESAA